MSDAITDGELKEIEARANAATAGPWKAYVEGRDHLSGDDFIRVDADSKETSTCT